uniref:MORN repeat protein n=1 Tax=Mimivirus LCMiAC02 TaxID=2506609 RepID=A0A481Z1B3_9VIRU|nr:MAG: uncharacterized protein LCMiAC02_00440 [Mimivirus LCMiAC02]
MTYHQTYHHKYAKYKKKYLALGKKLEHIIKYANGNVYEGLLDIFSGKPHGQGTLTHQDGTFYKGNWKYGKKHDHGVETYSDGYKYEGEWVDGEKHGSGTLIKKNGEIVNQEWKFDKLQAPRQEERIKLMKQLGIL